MFRWPTEKRTTHLTTDNGSCAQLYLKVVLFCNENSSVDKCNFCYKKKLKKLKLCISSLNEILKHHLLHDLTSLWDYHRRASLFFHLQTDNFHLFLCQQTMSKHKKDKGKSPELPFFVFCLKSQHIYLVLFSVYIFMLK